MMADGREAIAAGWLGPHWIGPGALLATLALSGCSLFGGDDDDDDTPMTVTDLGRGVACGPDRECRSGLVCRGVCEPPGNRPEGSSCQQSGDCEPGLWCSARRECIPGGDGEEGDACDATADCLPGFVCLREAVFHGRCRATGETDLGRLCETLTDCFAGLACLPDDMGVFRCLEPVGASGDEPPLPLEFWAGAECPDPPAEPLAWFAVPRGEDDDPDFHALPFPNDARRRGDGLDLSGHPSPSTVLDIDLVDRYLRAMETDLDGFSLNPVVWFRFSHAYDWDSVCASEDPCIPRFDFVDLDDPGAPSLPAIFLRTRGPLTKYACEDWLGVRTLHGRPLAEGRTYAVVVRRGITRADDGVPFEPSPDLAAVLADETPSDAALAGAWSAYGPLRDWLDATGDDVETVLNAAVFTTQSFDDIVPGLRAAVAAEGAPSPSGMTGCDTGVTSPCDDGEARVCATADPAFAEIHGRLDLPRFQAGAVPFETPDNGGAIPRDAEGRPVVQGRDDVCFALTLPRDAPMPEGGWPLVVYLHGTGGSIRSAVGAGLARRVAEDPGAATLTIDLPMHGDRRGDSERPPQELFFNFVNPRAARDNVLQGTADLFAVLEAAAAFDVSAVDGPTGQAIAFDAGRIVVFAHSQGASHAALALPWEDRPAAVVLSGLGGDLVQSLLTKTEPVDIAGILPFALLDANREGRLGAGDFHPALSLFQTFMDRVDPVNYGRGLRLPPGPSRPGHVLMTYGLGDTFSPEPSMQAYALAARLPLVRSCPGGGPCMALAPIPRLTEVDPPVSENVVLPGGAARTMGLRQYDPPTDVDGHFVAWRSDQGLADTTRFVRGALAAQAPTIGEPP